MYPQRGNEQQSLECLDSLETLVKNRRYLELITTPSHFTRRVKVVIRLRSTDIWKMCFNLIPEELAFPASREQLGPSHGLLRETIEPGGKIEINSIVLLNTSISNHRVLFTVPIMEPNFKVLHIF